MNAALLALSIGVFLTTTCAFAQQSLTPQKFVVFPGHRPTRQTVVFDSKEEREGETLNQVFWQRDNPNRELFRVRIGSSIGRELVKLWNCGIVANSDFNGDGKQDYVWYGGDDTSQSIVLFLSAGEEFKRTDIIKTASAAWERRFQKSAPDFGSLDGYYGIRSVVVDWSGKELTLDIVIGQRFEGEKKRGLLFRVSQSDFRE